MFSMNSETNEIDEKSDLVRNMSQTLKSKAKRKGNPVEPKKMPCFKVYKKSTRRCIDVLKTLKRRHVSTAKFRLLTGTSFITCKGNV